MKVLKSIILILAALLVGGIVLQVIGYVDSPLFRWFTDMELFR